MNLHKKVLLFFLIGLLFFVSCGTMNKSLLQKTKNVALISVYCRKDVSAPDFQGLATALNILSHSKDFDLTEVANNLRDDFYHKYADVFQFNVMPESNVINNALYKSLKNEQGFKLTVNQNLVTTPIGFYGISPLEKGKIKKIINELNADAVAIVYADYSLEKSGMQIMGFGKAYVQSTLGILLFDKDGKKIFYKYIVGNSKNKLKFILGGVFKTSEILPLCQDATAQAEKKMDAWITKQFAKVE